MTDAAADLQTCRPASIFHVRDRQLDVCGPTLRSEEDPRLCISLRILTDRRCWNPSDQPDPLNETLFLLQFINTFRPYLETVTILTSKYGLLWIHII